MLTPKSILFYVKPKRKCCLLPWYPRIQCAGFCFSFCAVKRSNCRRTLCCQSFETRPSTPPRLSQLSHREYFHCQVCGIICLVFVNALWSFKLYTIFFNDAECHLNPDGYDARMDAYLQQRKTSWFDSLTETQTLIQPKACDCCNSPVRTIVLFYSRDGALLAAGVLGVHVWAAFPGSTESSACRQTTSTVLSGLIHTGRTRAVQANGTC